MFPFDILKLMTESITKLLSKENYRSSLVKKKYSNSKLFFRVLYVNLLTNDKIKKCNNREYKLQQALEVEK